VGWDYLKEKIVVVSIFKTNVGLNKFSYISVLREKSQILKCNLSSRWLLAT